MLRISKSWTVLILAKSGQFEFVVEFYAILGDFGQFWAIFAKKRKIGHVFLQNPPKIAPNRPESPIFYYITTNSNLSDLANIKSARVFEFLAIFGDFLACLSRNFARKWPALSNSVQYIIYPIFYILYTYYKLHSTYHISYAMYYILFKHALFYRLCYCVIHTPRMN